MNGFSSAVGPYTEGSGTSRSAPWNPPIAVRADKTGFRQKPDPGSRVLAVFPRGKALVELSRWKGWVQAGDPADGRIGWLRGTLVEAAK